MTAARAPRRRARRGATGSIAPFIAIVTLGFLLLGGLVVDGARQLDAHGRATAYAEEAARAGVQRILLDFGDTQLDEELAYAAVTTYCEAASANDSTITDCRATDVVPLSDSPTNPVSVTVEVHVSVDPMLLSMIGISSLDASSEAKASPVQGINDPAEDYSLAPPTVDPDLLDPGIGVGTETTLVTPPAPCLDDPATPNNCDPPPSEPNCDNYPDDGTLPNCEPPHCNPPPANQWPPCVPNPTPPSTPNPPTPTGPNPPTPTGPSDPTPTGPSDPTPTGPGGGDRQLQWPMTTEEWSP